MNEDSGRNIEASVNRILIQAIEENIRATQHAQQEMTEAKFTLDDVVEGIKTGNIIENYPEDK